MILYIIGCAPTEPPASVDTSADTSVDTSIDTAIDTSADTSIDTSDTGEEPLSGGVAVSGHLNDQNFEFVCAAGDAEERFSRYWSNSLGNIAGSFTCVEDGALTVSFIQPAPGNWSDPSGGMAWVYTDTAGTIWSWYSPPPTFWSLRFEEAAYLDTTTLFIAGDLTATWEAGAVFSSFSLQIPCNNCG